MIPIRALTSRRALLGLALATGLAGHVLSQEAPAPSPSAASQEAAVQALPGAQVSELDGVTVRFADWWCNLRASNTEPVVRLNLEADTAAARDARLAEIKALITR